EIVDVVVDGAVGAIGAEVLAVNIAHQIQLERMARRESQGFERVIEDVAGVQVEGAAEKRERALRHAIDLEAEQFGIALGKGAIEILELDDRVTHGGARERKTTLGEPVDDDRSQAGTQEASGKNRRRGGRLERVTSQGPAASPSLLPLRFRVGSAHV